MPTGGCGHLFSHYERDSGFGREHGTAAIDNFTEPKAVWMNLNV